MGQPNSVQTQEELLRKSADGNGSNHQTDLSHGYAGDGIAIQDHNAHMDLHDLATEVLRHRPLAQQFHKIHQVPFNSRADTVAATAPPA
jgi:hypothetical protein